MNVELITFDLDNTLWETDRVMHRAHDATEAWLRDHVPDYSELSREKRGEIHRWVLDTRPDIRHDVTAIRINVIQLSLLAVGVPEAEANVLAREAFEVFIHHRCQVELYEGAQELLACLDQSFILGTITNGNADVKLTSLNPYFRFNVSAADVGVMKPDLKIFQRALGLADVQNPAQAIHIGDSEEDDVQGALNAGMKAVWINLKEDDRISTDATLTVGALKDVESAVQEICNAA